MRWLCVVVEVAARYQEVESVEGAAAVGEGKCTAVSAAFVWADADLACARVLPLLGNWLGQDYLSSTNMKIR